MKLSIESGCFIQVSFQMVWQSRKQRRKTPHRDCLKDASSFLGLDIETIPAYQDYTD
jgi:hypothetical protein